MPGFDGRGPEGMGPVTGGGRGLCNTAGRSFFNRGASFTGGAGRGRGFGSCRRQPGMGRRAGFGGGPVSSYYSRDLEESSLKNEAAVLRDELNAIEKRLKEIEETD